MPQYERSQNRETDPKRILDRYLRPLHKTQTEVRDFRMKGHLGESSTEFFSHPSVDPKVDFATWANRYAETLDDTDPAKAYAQIIGVVPMAIRGINNLEQKGKNRWNTRQLSRLNSTISFMIDTQSSITPDALEGVYKSTALNYGYSSEEINKLLDTVKNREQGMRHEIGHDAIMYRLPGDFEMLETTEDDDLNGIDRRWRCPNGAIVTFDIKASPETAEKADRLRAAFYRRAHRQIPANEMIIHSGLYDEDFQHPWRPSEEAIARELPRMQRLIYRAAGMELPSDLPSEVKW